MHESQGVGWQGRKGRKACQVGVSITMEVPGPDPRRISMGKPAKSCQIHTRCRLQTNIPFFPINCIFTLWHMFLCTQWSTRGSLLYHLNHFECHMSQRVHSYSQNDHVSHISRASFGKVECHKVKKVPNLTKNSPKLKKFLRYDVLAHF